MARKTRRWLGWVIAAAAVLLVAAIVFGAWLWLTRQPYPQTRGRIRLQGLTAEVEVLRDRYGVPHIYARSAEDLFFAQGFVHAQDRFWQMEFWRRISSGRLSELFGKSTLETDKFLRTLGLYRVAQREVELLSPDTRRYLEAYAAGVNAYALKRRPARLGLEFALLALQGVKVRIQPWTPADSIAWGKMMAYDLGGNHETERLHLDVLRSAGLRGWASFFAPYRPDMPITVNDEELRRMLGAALGLGGAAPATGTGLVVGSNNWVVSGRRTASGKPLLANDMHLAIQMPSIWYEIALHGVAEDGTVRRTAACPFQVRGLSFPGAPGVIAGHNDRIAWGHTNLGGDVQDFYVERLNPDNPDQYEVNGRWVDMEVRVETIKVRKADEPVRLRVRTTRHGPVLSDRALWSELGGYTVTPGREFPDGVGLTAVALRWTALEPGRLFEAVLRLDRASDFREFREALRYWDVPAQNIVYADVDGNIGYQVPGLQPIRARGHGLAPAPGWTDQYEWTGYIPYEKLPYLFNPEEGYIVTANARMAGPSYPYFLGSEYLLRGTGAPHPRADRGRPGRHHHPGPAGHPRGRVRPVRRGAGPVPAAIGPGHRPESPTSGGGIREGPPETRAEGGQGAGGHERRPRAPPGLGLPNAPGEPRGRPVRLLLDGFGGGNLPGPVPREALASRRHRPPAEFFLLFAPRSAESLVGRPGDARAAGRPGPDPGQGLLQGLPRGRQEAGGQVREVVAGARCTRPSSATRASGSRGSSRSRPSSTGARSPAPGGTPRWT